MAGKGIEKSLQSDLSFGTGTFKHRLIGSIDFEKYSKYGISPYILNDNWLTASEDKKGDLLANFFQERFSDYHCVIDPTLALQWTGREIFDRYELVRQKYGEGKSRKKLLNSTIFETYQTLLTSFRSSTTGEVNKMFTAKITLAGNDVHSLHIESFEPRNAAVVLIKNLVLQSITFECDNVFLTAAVHDQTKDPLQLIHLAGMSVNQYKQGVEQKFIQNEDDNLHGCYVVGEDEKMIEAITRYKRLPTSNPPVKILRPVDMDMIMKTLKQNLQRLEETPKEIINSGDLLDSDKLTKRQKRQIEQKSSTVPPSKSKTEKKGQHYGKKLTKSRKVNKKQQKQGEISVTSSDQESEDQNVVTKAPDEKNETLYGYDSQQEEEEEEDDDKELPGIDPPAASAKSASTAGQKGGRKRLTKQQAKKNKKKGGMKKGSSMQSLLPETRERSKKPKDDEDDFDDVPHIEVARGDEEPRDKEFMPNFSLSDEVYTQLDKKFIDILSYLEGCKDEKYIDNLKLMKQCPTPSSSLIEFLLHSDSLLQDSYSLLDGLRVNIAQIISSNDLMGFEASYTSCYLKYHTLRLEFSEKINVYIQHFLSMNLMSIFENMIDILTYFKVKVQFAYVLGYILKFNSVFGNHDDGMFNKMSVSFRAIKAEIELYNGNELKSMFKNETIMVKVMGKMNDLELLWSLYEQQVQIKLLDYQEKGSYAATDHQKNHIKQLCLLNGQYKDQISSLKSELMTAIKGFSPPFAIMKSEIELKIWTLFDGCFKEILDYLKLPFFDANLNLCDRTCTKILNF